MRSCWCAVFVLLCASVCLGQPPERRRPLPPLNQQVPEYRQGGLSENVQPAPAPTADRGWRPWDFNPAGDYSGEYPEPEIYVPEPLSSPPYVVPTIGLPPTAPSGAWQDCER
jgi:hypothetical protein